MVTKSQPPPSNRDPTPKAGDVLDGKYEIQRPIGSGAWGDVYEGVNMRIKRKVAIKVLKGEYAARKEMVARFEREALAATHIESPYVVQVYDAGTLPDGRPYIVMEFLTGDDLGKRLHGGKIGTLDAVNFCVHAARGLAAAHAEGIFHRDMKPDNLFIAKQKSGEEIAKIVDFGISKLVSPDDKSQNMTRTGHVLGSPVYMSPEQARGSKTSDHRSDLYSLGVVLYEAVTGRTPFNAETFNELMFKIALEEPPAANSISPEIGEALSALLTKSLKRAPEDRFQTAEEFERALVEWLESKGASVREWKNASGSGPGSHVAAAIQRSSLEATLPGPFLEGTNPPAAPKPKVPRAVFALAAVPVLAIGLFLLSHKAPAHAVADSPSATATVLSTQAVPNGPTPVDSTASTTMPSSAATTPEVTPSATLVPATTGLHATHPTIKGSASAAASASAPPSAAPAASVTAPGSASTANVGGRTIHTTL